MERYFPFVFFLFVFTTTLCAQGGYFNISNSYGTEPTLFKSIETSDGNILSVGKFESNPDMVRGFISKRTPTGAEIWTKTFGSGVTLSYYLVDEPVDILETRDSSYLLTCWSAHYTRNGDYSDGFYLVKLRANGDTVFHKRYHIFPDYWGPFCMTETPDGNLYCAVNSCYYCYVPDSSFTQVISLDSNGNITGIKKYKSAFTTMISDIVVDGNTIYLSGVTNAPDSATIQFVNPFVIKADTSGTIDWSRVYSCTADSFWLKRMVIENGYILLAGMNLQHPDITLSIFIDSTGVPLSGKKIFQFRLIDVTLNADSSLSWLVYSLDSLYSGCYLNRSNFNIDTIFFSRLQDFNYSLQFETTPTRISCTHDNTILAGAYYWSGTGNDSSVVLIKIDSLNNPGCPSSPGITSRLITPVVVNWDILSMQLQAPDLYSTYYAFPYTNDYDITINNVSNLCNQVFINEINSYEAEIFPNPFHSEAKMESRQLSGRKLELGIKELRIYNSMGSLVRTEKISNLQSYILRRNRLNNGLYFYELRSNNYELIGSGKFIIE